MAFPTSPSNNQLHKIGNRAWVYDSTLAVWDQVREADSSAPIITSGAIGSAVRFPPGMMRFITTNEPKCPVEWFQDGNQVTQQITITSGSKVLIDVGFNFEDRDADTSSYIQTYLSGDGTSGLGSAASGIMIQSAMDSGMAIGHRGSVHANHLATPTGTSPTYKIYLAGSGSPKIKWWYAYMTFYEIYQ